MQLVFEIATALGWESLRAAVGKSRRPPGVLAAVGLVLMGGLSGVLSVLAFGRRLTPAGGVPGASLVLAPLGTGIVMGWLGRRWRRRGQTPPPMFTFVGGATFAAAMAIVRFMWIERARWL